MALFRGIQEYIALDANNITLVFDSGKIVNISGNIFLYPPRGHPILYNYWENRVYHAPPPFECLYTQPSLKKMYIKALTLIHFDNHSMIRKVIRYSI